MVSGPVPTVHVPDLGPPRHDVRVTLTPGPFTARQARLALLPLRRMLAGPVYEDLRVVVTELVTNAVRHGRGASVRVVVDLHDDQTVRGEVSDDEAVPTGAIRIRTGGEDGGWGLRIVDALASWWGVEEGTNDVWFVLRRD